MKKVLIILVSYLFLVLACGSPEPEKSAENKAVFVRSTEVRRLEYQVPVRATGLLGTATEMKLSFKTGGIVRQVLAKEGSSVKRGEVLAELDMIEIRAQASQARIGLEKARRDRDRAKNLYLDSVATLEQYQNARSAYDLALAQNQIADFNLKHSRIVAPSDGKIQKVLVEASEVIAPGYPAILFASTENDWVLRVSLTDKDIVKLSLDDSARVYMDAFPGSSFLAGVSELGGIADPLTGTYEAELLIVDALPQFRTGFISRAEIFPAGQLCSLVVPIESILDVSDRHAAVFVSRGEKAEKRRILTGHILDSLVVVVEGLEEGEEVITEGARYLRDGSRISLVNYSKASGS